jgi:hypothetical protein
MKCIHCPIRSMWKYRTCCRQPHMMDIHHPISPSFVPVNGNSHQCAVYCKLYMWRRFYVQCQMLQWDNTKPRGTCNNLQPWSKLHPATSFEWRPHALPGNEAWYITASKPWFWKKCRVRPWEKLLVHSKHTIPCFNKGCSPEHSLV